MPSPVHLTDGRVSIVVGMAGGCTEIVYWGAALGVVDLDAMQDALRRPVTGGALDSEAPASLVPEHGSGYPGRPGLAGHRSDGTGWAPRFTRVSATADTSHVAIVGRDEVAGLELETRVELEPSGLLHVGATVTNVGDSPYTLGHLELTVPLPAHAVDVITFHGRWCRELHPHRQTLLSGAVDVENRTGRTSHEHPPLVWAGEHGFGEQHGDVWGIHLAWSGNAHLRLERLPDGRRVATAGELLGPGEIVLDPGAAYSTPPVLGAYSPAGLTDASRAYHRYVRALPAHRTRPRPVLVNTWEAVYFDHDPGRLRELADRAAQVGAERFVLDDGWFAGRRDDTSSLGDWWVSADVHPDGLAPLIEHVRGLGMEFGLWVEPEMVNPDSDLYRAHPDWVLQAPGYEPVLGRHQLVLDLTRHDAFTAVHDRLDRLLRDHDIAFLKWDMNRVHVAASDAAGRAATHAQTLAVYRLIDQLRDAHPDVEIESCASGGGRIDFGILERTERVWTSDCNDALERQTIQRWASTLIPPEVMGAHIGPPRSHTTGRTHSLSFRAATAFFGHLGLEWNLLDLDDAELARVAAIVALHRRHRDLLHTGDVLRIDRGDDGTIAHGVVAPDRSAAIVSLVRLTTSASLLPDPLRIPDLDQDRTYEIADLPLGRGRWLVEPVRLTGRQLARHGLQPPAMNPESARLIHLHGEAAA